MKFAHILYFRPNDFIVFIVFLAQLVKLFEEIFKTTVVGSNNNQSTNNFKLLFFLLLFQIHLDVRQVSFFDVSWSLHRFLT